MQVDIEQRMTEAATIVHATGEVWTATTYPRCAWQVRRRRYIGADGLATEQDVLVVQIPEDQGVVEVGFGDYLVRGEFAFEGPIEELVEVLPDTARRVQTIRDLRKGLFGIGGPISRYASVLVLECA